MSPAASQPGRSSPHNLPSPPADDSKSSASRKSITSLSKNKPIKQAPRVSKRANTSVAIARHHHEQATHSSGMDGRHKRVWKACERCRMKKTKCDGEFPCKRCRDDGLVCTAGIRKKTEYKTLPKGYGEVLESTQVTLVATCHKLFSMLVNGEKWDLGDPGLNERGLPIVHNIAQKLGCVRPNNDIDLPTYSVFPEDETTMAQVARELQEQEDAREPTKTSVSQISVASPSRPVKVEDQHQHQRQRSQQQQQPPRRQDMHRSLRDSESSSSTYNGTERASSSELEHSDLEMDYRRAAFGSNPMTLSPQSFTTSNDMDFGGPTMSEIETPAMFPSQSPTAINFASWASAKPQTSRPLSQLIPETNSFQAFEMLNQGLLESEFGVMKPHYSNSDVMMGNADPMIFAGSFENYGDYDPDQMKFLPQMK